MSKHALTTVRDLMEVLIDYCPDTPILTPLFPGDENTTITKAEYEGNIPEVLSLYITER